MLTKFLKNYGYMILGGAMILGFSAFKGVEHYAGEKLAPATVYFHGDENDPAEVADESNWTTTPNGQTCSSSNQLPCMIKVDHTDLSGSQLDSVKVTLNAIAGTSGPGFIPQHVGGTGTQNPTIINRN